MTVVIPAYNEARAVAQTAAAVFKAFADENIPCRILFVDDGSSDGTWAEIEAAGRLNTKVSGIRLSRNFGKEAAVSAGLDHVTDFPAVIMDADLQHPPEAAVGMYRLWEAGNIHIVEGVKRRRQDESLFNRLFANLFYGLLKSFSGLNLKNASDFKLLDETAVRTLRQMPERHTFFRAMTGWTGLNTTNFEYNVNPRVAGETKFNRMKLIKLAVNSITSYSSVPLQFVTLCGVLFTVFSFIMGTHTLYMWLAGHSVAGFTTVILLLLIIGGVIMIGLGAIGHYTAKIYDEVRQRPRYIIGDRTDDH
jgi:dolichol-phosphate mannosyltransferase